MLALSTGTNNAFPIMKEATVAGMAVGLIATGRAHAPTARAKALHVDVTRATAPPPRDRPGRRVRQHHRRDRLAGTLENRHAARAVLHLCRTRRDRAFLDPGADPADQPLRARRLAGPTPGHHPSRTVLAPIAPGLLETVGLKSCEPLRPGITRYVRLTRGTIALDGERELEFGPGDRIAVTLAADGPRVIDVPATLAGDHSCSSDLVISSIAEEIR